MGGFALFNVAGMVYGGMKTAPEWARLAAAFAVGLLGVTCLVLAIKRHYGKKPTPPPKPMRKQPLTREVVKSKGGAGEPS
jgi:hypothetical protein